jgi:hypothetical protein
MAKIIENAKNYTGTELDQIFIRPTFTGEDAKALGIRVMYNIPQNTTMNFFAKQSNILKEFSSGWQGGEASKKYQKTIEMAKVKAEVGYQAEDYFATIFEKITNRSDVSLQDLTGTDLAKAEEELFREAIAEDLRSAMWVGDTAGTLSDYITFDGFLKKASTYTDSVKYKLTAPTASNIIGSFKAVWNAASETLRAMKSTGKLVFFVTSDVYNALEEAYDGKTNSVAYGEMVNGRSVLRWHGIEVKEMQADSRLKVKQSVILLAHKDNLVLAVNTSDMPSAGVRMWYNPDENENRQRAAFLASAEILDESLIVFASTANA